GQSVVQGLSASLDGSRMLVGWSDDPDDFIVLKDFNGSWEVQAEGDGTTNRPWGMSIVKRSDGKYIGFEYNGGSLYAADVSDPLPTAHYDYPDGGGRSAAPVFNTYRVPNTSFDPNTPTMQLSGLQQAGNYVAYPGDLDRTSATTARNGNAIILVDASKPLGNPNIASNFTVKRLSMSVLGIPTGLDNNGFLTATINSFTMTASQSDPDTIYLFVETTKSSAPGPIYVYKISSSGSVIKPVTGSPVNPPAPFTGTGSQNDRGRPFAYTTSDKSRAFFVRQTSSLVGFVNVTVKDSAVSVNVATAPYSISTTAELSGMQGFEENNTAYIYTAHGSFMNAWKINCNTASTSPSVKIDSFTATPPIIKNGESSKLTWQTTSTFPTNVGRNYVTLNGEPVGEDGERTVEPNRTTNYILKISRSEDSGAASADSCTAKVERFDDSPNRPRIFASGYLNYLSLYGNAVKKLMIGQNFGYTVASLINPASPVVAGHDNMITAGGGGPIEKVGDGQSTVMELATSPDGQRALVGWTDSPHDVFVLSPNGDIFKVVAHFGSYRPTGVGIVQRSDGKYFGFELQYQYLFVADITSLPSEEMTTSEVSELKNKIEEEAINHPTSGTNGFARTAGHFFGYKKDGEALGIVYAGAPYSGGSIANILKTFTVTPRDLGVGAYTINDFTLVSTPNNPDIAYIFADLAGGLKGGPMAVATINSSGVVKPLAGSPITVPAPFTTGQLEFNSIAGFYNGSEPQATIIRGTVDSWGFINIKASSNNLSISVATLPKADFNSSRDIVGWGNGKNTYIYTAQSTKVSAVTITCNNTGGPTPPSGTCTAPNCASAMRVVTVGNDGGGGTGTGGEDDGTGRRSWFWWLKYYLNL
ncbi:hypothetical protein IT399_02860, partial [Candidatus Nomurabacteria bacterium]|nr:hypothetical protein [Candidatus Nomurabacteria bacterium]